MSKNSPLKGNAYMLIIMIWQILISFAVPLIKHVFGIQLFNSQLSIIPLHFILFILPFILYLMFASKKLSDVLPMKKLSFVNFSLILLMCVTIQPLMMVLSGLMTLLFPNNVSTAISELYSLPIYITVLATALTPAITEEITLRGVLLTNYENIGIKKAALVNGLLFGILHLDPQQLPYAFMLGFLFAYFVYYTKSIFASITAHFAINFLQTALAYMSLSVAEQAEIVVDSVQTSDTELLAAIVSLSVIALIFTPVFIVLYRAFVSYNRRRLIDSAFADTSSTHDYSLDIPEAAPLIPDKNNRIINWPFITIVCVYILFIILAVFTA